MTDLIRRADAIEAVCHNCAYYTDAQCKTDSGYWCESGAMIREDIPSAVCDDCIWHVCNYNKVDWDAQTDCTEFVNWLMEEVMDDDNWELNAVALGEIICRKLKKLGLLEVKDGYYIRQSAEAVQGEWIMHIDDLFPCESTQECSVCHAEQPISISDDNFCPNCGARMTPCKGGEDE